MRIPRPIQWSLYISIIFLVLFTLFRFLFYMRYHPGGAAFPAGAFWMGFKFDARIAAVIGGLVLLLALIPALRPWQRPRSGRFWIPFLVVLAFLVLFFYVIDYYHYDYLQQRLNGASISLLKEAALSAQMVWQTYPVIRILIALVLLAVLFAFFFRKLFRSMAATDDKPLRRRWPFYVVYALLLFAAAWGSVSQFALRWSDVFAFPSAFEGQLALNPFQSLASTLKFRTSSYDRNKVAAHYDEMAPYLGVKELNRDSLRFERPVGVAANTLPKGTNVVLVICESFSSYKSSMWGNPLNTTPYFKSLCDSGVFFRNCFTNSYSTARGVWATLTGLPDVERNGSSSRNIATVDQHILMNDFAGYSKYYFIGGSASWANIRGMLQANIAGLNLVEQEQLEGKQVDVWGVSDKNLLVEATTRLSKETKPFFAVIQTADNHRPYTIPEEDKNEFREIKVSEAELRAGGFGSNEELNAFRYTDFCFQKFMASARQQPWFANTLFVFVGDHGIGGPVGKLMPSAWGAVGLESFHVPLLFYAPGRLQPAQRTTLSSQIDIMPSIASLSGVYPRYTSLGKNLFDSTGTDPRRWNSSFLFSPNDASIGLFMGDTLLYRPIGGGRKRMLSLSDAPIEANAAAEARLNALAEGWWETSRWLLYHNRKK